MNNYENNMYGLSIFYKLIEAALMLFAPIPLYSNREKQPSGIFQNPHDFE